MYGDVVVVSELQSVCGLQRLSLRYLREGEGLNFHSLLLEAKQNEVWVAVSEITQAEFQKSHPNRRWISELHGFTPSTGCAIVQVGECDQSLSANGTTQVLYSWRRWDIKDGLNN